MARFTPPQAQDTEASSEIRFWLRANRSARGGDSPFFAEVRLAFAHLGFGSPNVWRRLVPIAQANTWELARMSLNDAPLDGDERILTGIELRSLGGEPGFALEISTPLAVVPELMTDVEAGLIDRLGGSASVFVDPDRPQQQNNPFLLLTPEGLEYAGERRAAPAVRGDFTGGGFRLTEQTEAFTLHYRAEAFANTRLAQSRMLDHAMERLAPSGEILVNGSPRRVELISTPGLFTEAVTSGALHFSVFSWRETSTDVVVRDVSTVEIETEPLDAAPAGGGS